MCSDLQGPLPAQGGDGAEPLTLSPQRIHPVFQERFHHIGSRIGGEVEIKIIGVATQHQVTNRATHDVEPMARLRERLGNRRKLRNHCIEARRLHELQVTECQRH